MNFSRQAYYQWAANPVLSRDWEEAHLINAAIDHHRDDPAFGYRFIADEINAGPGPVASERRIWRLCSEKGILSVNHRRRQSGLKAGPPVHDDLIERDFSATAPNRKWLTDITEHHTGDNPSCLVNLQQSRLISMSFRADYLARDSGHDSITSVYAPSYFIGGASSVDQTEFAVTRPDESVSGAPATARLSVKAFPMGLPTPFTFWVQFNVGYGGAYMTYSE